MSDLDYRPDTPLPRLRGDLELHLIEHENEEMLLLRDPAGYSDETLLFSPKAWALLSLFDGIRSIATLQQEIFQATKVHVDTEQLLSIVRSLDKYFFLDNQRYRDMRSRIDQEYADSPIREAVHAGVSYPEDAEELRSFLSELFARDTSTLSEQAPIGIIAPHIDLKIGPEVYVPAFRALQRARVDTVVILGTSHYSDEDMFILTAKDFVTPLGVASTDKEFVETLRERSGGVFTTSDVAHRMEHSIEFPLLFLQHIFGERVPRVLPVLVTSFDDHFTDSEASMENERYAAFIHAFRETVTQLGRKVAFVVSVDWSHVGRKFGDALDAADIRDDVVELDHKQLAALERCDYTAFRETVLAGLNATHIDGFSCITTFFELTAPKRASLLAYRQWHEVETSSAVSFASMAFYDSEAEAVTAFEEESAVS